MDLARDKTKLLFGVLNVAQGVVIGGVPFVVESREPAVNWIIWATAAGMLLAGPMLVFGGRIGRVFAAAACLVHGAVGTVLAALVVGAASYLLSIYGRHGHSVGSIAFVLAFVALLVFWLVPAHELHYLRRLGSER